MAKWSSTRDSRGLQLDVKIIFGNTAASKDDGEGLSIKHVRQKSQGLTPARDTFALKQVT